MPIEQPICPDTKRNMNECECDRCVKVRIEFKGLCDSGKVVAANPRPWEAIGPQINEGDTVRLETDDEGTRVYVNDVEQDSQNVIRIEQCGDETRMFEGGVEVPIDPPAGATWDTWEGGDLSDKPNELGLYRDNLSGPEGTEGTG